MDETAWKGHNIGFISTRLAGTDGVSLETRKWADIFTGEGLTCYYFAGELDTPPECSYLFEKAHFTHPAIVDIHENCFGVRVRGRYITQRIQNVKRELKDHLYRFIEKFQIDIIVVENALSIPLNLPLGIAITEIISEIGIPAIAHHHDFYWERERFLTNSVAEYLNMAFPPNLAPIKSVVINSAAGNQLSLRTGISPTIIPNVMNFESPPPPSDDYTKTVRHDLGIETDELFILQPTRVVQRKGIEHAIELVNRLGRKARLVISHAAGDEGLDYYQRVKEFSDLLGVRTVFVSEVINEKRGLTSDGRKIYTLNDIYPCADLVTYPSNYEGFGNAFLEAVYFRRPIAINNYSIYATDIRPKGFSVIEINGFVTGKTVEQARRVLDDADFRRKMVDHNYETALRYYSYSVLRQKLKTLIIDCLGYPF
ncbi:MAG: glycosyltransferase family 4 protein [Thermodesulfobacteriota bacterium]